jgi:hypothetical protein
MADRLVRHIAGTHSARTAMAITVAVSSRRNSGRNHNSRTPTCILATRTHWQRSHRRIVLHLAPSRAISKAAKGTLHHLGLSRRKAPWPDLNARPNRARVITRRYTTGRPPTP